MFCEFKTLVMLPAALLAATTGLETDGQEVAVAAKSRIELSVTLHGMDEDKADSVRESLVSLVTEAYTCPSCDSRSFDPGTCEGCDEELGYTELPLLSGVRTDHKQGLVTFSIAHGLSLHLSDLEWALQDADVKLDRSRLPLPTNTRIDFEGVADDAVAEKLERALKTVGFTSVETLLDEAMEVLSVTVTAGAKPPRLGAVTSALEALELERRPVLLDIVWSARRQQSS